MSRTIVGVYTNSQKYSRGNSRLIITNFTKTVYEFASGKIICYKYFRLPAQRPEEIVKTYNDPMPLWLIGFGLVFSHGLTALTCWLGVLTARSGDWGWTVILLAFAYLIAKMLNTKDWRDHATTYFAHYQTVRITRKLRVLLSRYEKNVLYTGYDLTQGKYQTVLCLNDVVVTLSDAGYLIFDRRPCAHWCISLEDYLFKDRVAMPEELQGLVHRLTTYV